MPQNQPNKKLLRWIYILFAIVTFLAYSQACLNDFINYDDDVYITENPNVHNGLTLESVKWAFTSRAAANWHPLTWLSHILDCELFGLNPAWHHFTSILLHTANILLLLKILLMMTGSLWPSVVVTAFFAFHPLQVESVAWAAERKNLLSGFFWLLTVAVYIRYAKKTTPARYLLVCAVFVMALMSKPAAVTLPFALLLLDFWPLQRLHLFGKNKTPATSAGAKIILEKVPMLFFSAADCVITIIVQRAGGAVKTGPAVSLDIRLANAIVSYLRYIFKIFYPAKLAIFYPYPLDSLPLWQPVFYLAVLVLITAAAVFFGRRCRYLITGWFWYLGTLVPVIGIIQVGDQAMADRYMYIPSLGIFIIVVWLSNEVFPDPRHKKILLAVAACIIAALLFLTQQQLNRWKDNLTLFGYTLSVTEDNFIMHNNYGNALAQENRVDEAVWHFKESLRIFPTVNAKTNLANAYMAQGHTGPALDLFNEILSVKPNNVKANYNLAVAMQTIDRTDLAIKYLRRVTEIDRNYLNAFTSLAWILATTDKPDPADPQEAVKYAQRACEITGYIRPDVLNLLAVCYAAAGDFEQALNFAEKAEIVARKTGHRELIDEIQKQKELYRNRQPYRPPK